MSPLPATTTVIIVMTLCCVNTESSQTRLQNFWQLRQQNMAERTNHERLLGKIEMSLNFVISQLISNVKKYSSKIQTPAV